ncbi:yheo domain protein [Bacillus sp. OxB-1]|uniref:helix-turn-helix transcriptional regulator n=1 Tax=Bacillus sp. (strain OxB-1) TaxID=98228 RepID=UPI000581C731|nr:PAS domain-containing protein [Bacillus sp. OxB-1]BAQ09978.1 yheo domain protein [Bacillus sp. OxB-1]
MEVEIIKTDIHPLLKSYIPVAEGIAKTFGDFCEVVLHDFTDVSSSIVAIFNGSVTSRGIGSPVTNLGLEILRKGEDGENMLINYANTLINQKKVKSSSILIRDPENEVIGCICINLDLTYLDMSKKVLEGVMSTISEKEKKEEFSPSINDLEDQIINEAISKVGKPIPLMQKEDREIFISYLDEKGLFLIKGAVQKVANMMNISKFTLYNYIDKSN